MVFAEHLAKTWRAKLILLGRSAFPKRDQWKEWLMTHGDEDRVSGKIGKYRNSRSSARRS